MDNYSAWERHQRDEDKWLESRPVCSFCGEHIQDEYAYRINDELICMDCLEHNFKVDMEDY